MQAVVVLAVAAAAGCGPEYKEHPQLEVIFTPSNPLDFGRWAIGTSPQGSLAITNRGLEDLVLSSVTLTGDSAFSKLQPASGSNPTLTTIPGNKSSFLTIVFTPAAARDYTGTVNIASNAENKPSQDVPVLGTGVP
jgi:hypothetical protein